MKKQFFYAAFALSMMASCTSEDTPLVEQPTTPEDDRVAIELGIDSPTITAAVSRGTGSVGDVAGANNNWNKQRLYIAMVNNNTDAGTVGNIAQEKDGNTTNKKDILTWNNYEYRAPSSGESGTIRIYDLNTYGKTANVTGEDGSITDNSDKGTLRYVYYPTQGTYDFYGWHVDAPAVTGTESATNIPQNGTPNISGGTATVTNISIDGTQDIMGARTKEFTYANYKGNEDDPVIDEVTFNTLAEKPWNFSARTARNGIKPILKFEHQLARLKFYVRAGSAKTIHQWDDPKVANDATTDGAMYITSLEIPNLVNKLDMNLNATVNQKKVVTTAVATDATATNTFKLGSLINGVVTPGTLTATAPTKVYADNTDENYKGDLVGESIMFFPYQNSETKLEIDLALKQYVQLTKDEVDENNNEYGFKYQDAKVTVNSSSIVGGVSEATKKFEAGKSYNIYITIYGFERIEVTAELTAWENGGDVDVDIEEGESKDPETPVTPTPAKKTFTFNVIGNTEAATISINDQEIQSTTYEAEVGQTFTWSVTVGTTTKTGSVTVGEDSVLTIDVDFTPAQAAEKEFTFTITNNVATPVIKIGDQTIEGTTYKAKVGDKFTWSVTDGENTITEEITVEDATETAINVSFADYTKVITVNVNVPQYTCNFSGALYVMEEAGQFRLYKNQAYTYEVLAEGYVTQSGSIAADDERTTIDITLVVENKTFTVKAMAGENAVYGTISLKYENGDDIVPNGNEYTLPIGTKIDWTVTPQQEGLEPITGTYEVTINTGNEVVLDCSGTGATANGSAGEN